MSIQFFLKLVTIDIPSVGIVGFDVIDVVIIFANFKRIFFVVSYLDYFVRSHLKCWSFTDLNAFYDQFELFIPARGEAQAQRQPLWAPGKICVVGHPQPPVFT